MSRFEEKLQKEKEVWGMQVRRGDKSIMSQLRYRSTMKKSIEEPSLQREKRQRVRMNFLYISAIK